MTRGYDAVRLRAGLREFQVQRVFRIIHRAYAPLGATPAPSRFSDPAGGYAVLYASETVRIGAPSAVAHDGNHAAGRALSAAVHAGLPEADGFLFSSRFTGDRCVAIFDRAFGKLQTTRIVELVRHAEFLNALHDYDIVLTDPPV